jgi:hypothetical protein
LYIYTLKKYGYSQFFTIKLCWKLSGKTLAIADMSTIPKEKKQLERNNRHQNKELS